MESYSCGVHSPKRPITLLNKPSVKQILLHRGFLEYF